MAFAFLAPLVEAAGAEAAAAGATEAAAAGATEAAAAGSFLQKGLTQANPSRSSESTGHGVSATQFLKHDDYLDDSHARW